MLTNQEKAFIEYWAENRLKKKKGLRQYYFGLPMATLLVVSIFANFFSGWYKRAEMKMRASVSPSLVIVLLIAALSIVAFIVIFSFRHKWETNEQYYRELLSKKDLP